MNLFEKGIWIKLTKDFVYDGIPVLENIENFQTKYKLQDVDTAINSIRDATIGYYLGAEEINIGKHGLDARYGDKFLEIKQSVIINSNANIIKEPKATFNDTNIEKCMAFRTGKVFLVLAIWESATNLLAMTFGNMISISDYLEKRIKTRKKGSRSTQSISLRNLLLKYNNKIYCGPNFSPIEVKKRLVVINKGLSNANIFKFDKMPNLRSAI